MLRRVLPVFFGLVAACDNTPSLPNLDVGVVDAVGASPLDSHAITSVRVRHREASEFIETTAQVENGTFGIDIALSDIGAESELRMEMLGTTGVLLTGSTPSFYPPEGQRVQLVVGAPGTCDVVTASQLPVEWKAFGAVTVGTFALLIGGIENGGPSERIGWHDLLLHGPGTVVFDLPNTPGRARAATISRLRALVVSEGDDPFIYDLYSASAPRTVRTLHQGARNASAVLATGDGMAVAVGGSHDGLPDVGVTFVRSTGHISKGALALALSERVAAYAQGGVYVVSYATGTTMLERVVAGAAVEMGDEDEPATVTTLIPSFADGTRIGGALFFDAAGGEGLLIGGKDELGAVRTDTVRFSGCPDACVTSSGPTWTTARARPMTDPAGYLVGGEGPSALVDRVVFTSTGPVITALGPLENARFDGGLLTHPSGTLVVLGGQGASGLRRDVEMCFPPSID